MNHLEHVKNQFGEVADSQENKGIEKYGQPLDPLESGRDWLDMEFEEIVDAAKYSRAEKVRRSFAVNKIRNLLDYNPVDTANVEIHYWLDFLEGKQ